MSPPPWRRLTSPSSDRNCLHDAQDNVDDTAAAAATAVDTTTSRLSSQDVDEIDDWLARLQRLEGALPSKTALPAPTGAPASSRTSTSRPTSLLVSPTALAVTGEVLSSTHTHNKQHTRRRSLNLFRHSSSPYSHAEPADHQLQLPSSSGGFVTEGETALSHHMEGIVTSPRGSETRLPIPRRDLPVTTNVDINAPSIEQEEVFMIASVNPEASSSRMSSSTTSFAPLPSSSVQDPFNPTAATLLSSSHSTKSISTIASNPSSSASVAAAQQQHHQQGKKLQPRSPFSSPKTTLSFRKKRNKGGAILDGKESDLVESDDEIDGTSGKQVRDAESGSGSEIIASHSSTGHVSPEDPLLRGHPESSASVIHQTQSIRAKKLSKSSFTSSIDSVRGSLVMSSNNSKRLHQQHDHHDRRESTDSKNSSQSTSQSHSALHLNFFSRNSSKHPHHPQQQQLTTSSSTASSSQYPKLVARDERFYSSRSTRPRFSSTRSASSLHLDSKTNANGNESSASEDEQNKKDDDAMSVSLLNIRRASISSTSPSYQRSKDDKKALLASSSASSNSTRTGAMAALARNRMSLAIPPPLMRSYSYDGRVTAANAGTAYDPAELAKHIPDMKQTVLLWIPEESSNHHQPDLHSSSSHSKLQSLNHPHYHHHHHSNHHNPSSAAKGIANAILSNVPLHGRKKNSTSGQRTGTENTHVVFASNLDEGSHEDLKQQYYLDNDNRQKHPSKLGSGAQDPGRGKGKEKDKASILLPVGQWRRCEALLKANGQLIISNGDTSLATVDLEKLQRTDIRPVDPSLLGRQRCVSLHIKKDKQSFPHYVSPTSPTYNKRHTPTFPLSPSAPDFSSFSTTSSLGKATGLGLDEPLHLEGGGGAKTLFLAFQTTAMQHAWIAAMLCHAQAEVYPMSAASKTKVSFTEEGPLSDGENPSAPSSTRQRPQFTQHSSWRQGAHADDGPVDHPIRMYRSVSLQIIQARCMKDHQAPPLTSSIAALAMSHAAHGQSAPVSPASPDMIQTQKRSGSIASTIASGDNMTSSTDGRSPITEPASAPLLPPHLKMTMVSNTSQHHTSQTKKTDSHKEKHKDHDRLELFVEIWHGSDIVGRTGIRNASAKTIWEEVFYFGNLGPYIHPLELRIYTIKKHQTQLAGTVILPLPTMQRNIATEGWYEMHPTDQALKRGHFDSQAEMNVRVHLKEDTALPYTVYSELGALLAEDTDSSIVLSLLGALHIELDLFSQLLLRIDLAHRRVLHRVISLCEKEVERTDNIATLFRGNTLLTKTIEIYMRLVGMDFLENSVGQVLRKLCEERVSIEIDPARLDPKDNLSDNVKSLEKWCEAIWDSMYNSRHSCPLDLRRMLRKVRQIVDQHCAAEQAMGRLCEAERSTARISSVSAFISLRFFCPAILRPNLFRLSPSHPPDTRTSRTLTLIAKVLMGMANMQTFGSKEPWMAAMNPFLQKNSSSYQDFITYLCSKDEGAASDWTEKDFEMYKVPILKRMTLVPDIVKEGIPELPFLVDLPKEYAAFASLVATAESASLTAASVEGSNDVSSGEHLHEELLSLCKSLHSQTRSRVRALARSGDVSAPSREHSKRLFARVEQVRLPLRARGSTVSKTLSTPSPDRTAILSQSSPAGGAEENRTALFASSPASISSLTGKLADLSTSLDSSSESQLSNASYRPKRRSYTVSASPSMSTSDTSPVSGSLCSKLVSVPPVDEVDDTFDILDIRNPAGSPIPPARDFSPRRLTIIAPRPLALDQSIPGSSPPPAAKTPRAPTFTREQSDTLRELQEHLSSTAVDYAAASIGGMPSPRAEPPLSPNPAPTKRKLFRKK